MSEHSNLVRALPRLLAELKREGLSCDVRVHIRARELLTALAADQASKATIGNSLCALVATSESEQEVFHQIFPAWWDQAQKPKGDEPAGPSQIIPRGWFRRFGIPLTAGLIVLGIVALIVSSLIEYYRDPVVSFSPGRLALSPGGEASLSLQLDKPTRAPLDYQLKVISDEADLVFIPDGPAIHFGKKDSVKKFAVRAGPKVCRVRIGVVGRDDLVAEIRVDYQRDLTPVKIPEVTNVLNRASGSILQAWDDGSGVESEKNVKRKRSAWLVLAFLPLGIWAGWSLLRWRVQNRYFKRGGLGNLARRMAAPIRFPEPRRVAAQSAVDEIALSWRPTVLTAAERLDLPGSVRRSIRMGGYFQPVNRSIRTRPRYLVLIDEKSFRDFSAALVRELVDSLHHSGIQVKSCSFSGSPDWCSAGAEGGGQRMPFRELARRERGARLLIFSDDLQLVDPLLGRDLPWIADLGFFNQPALFSRRTDAEAQRSRALAAAKEILVLPFHEDGLRFYGDVVNEIPGASWNHRRTDVQLPSGVYTDSSVWSSQIPPPDEEWERLRRWLRLTLGGEGMLSFAACAVYPRMDWFLVAELTRRLHENERFNFRDEAWTILCRLTALPWFRQGWMPDWLRRNLLEELAPEEEEAIRGILNDLLELDEVAVDEKKRDQTTLDESLRVTEDPLVTSVLGGDLSVPIPKRLREALGRQKARPWWRLAVAGVLTVAVASVGWKFIRATPEEAKPAVSHRILVGHELDVTSVAFSPDGATLASGSGDKSIKLWDAESVELKKTLTGHENIVTSVAFSPDGATLASSSFDKSIKLWDVESGELKRTLTDREGSITSVAFSPDGATLASGGDDSYKIKLWDVKSGQLKQTLTGHGLSVAFSPDGATLASGSRDNSIKLWDVESGQLKQTLTGHEGSVFSVAFSPDGATLASGSLDTSIKLWDVESGQIKQSLTGHESPIYIVVFSPDGATLASGSFDSGIKVWEVESGQLNQTLTGEQDRVLSMAFSPDGATLANSGADAVKLWDLGVPVPQAAALSDDLATVAVSGTNGETGLWDVETGELLRDLGGEKMDVTALGFWPIGDLLSGGTRTGSVHTWELDQPEVPSTPESIGLTGADASEIILSEIPDGPIHDLEFSPNGVFWMIWETEQGNQIGGYDFYGEVEISPISRPGSESLAIAGADGWGDGWIEVGGRRVKNGVFAGHAGEVIALNDYEREILAVGKSSGELEMWNYDAANDSRLRVQKQAHEGAIVAVAISPDSRFVATAGEDGTVKVWHASTGNFLAEEKGHGEDWLDLKFSGDGHRLGAISRLRQVRTWNTPLDEAEVLDRIFNRQVEIWELKNDRIVGEGRRGLLYERNRPNSGWPDAYVKSTIASENADREFVMKNRSDQRNLPLVQIEFEEWKRRVTDSFKGEWIQVIADGGEEYLWKKKEGERGDGSEFKEEETKPEPVLPGTSLSGMPETTGEWREAVMEAGQLDLGELSLVLAEQNEKMSAEDAAAITAALVRRMETEEDLDSLELLSEMFRLLGPKLTPEMAESRGRMLLAAIKGKEDPFAMSLVADALVSLGDELTPKFVTEAAGRLRNYWLESDLDIWDRMAANNAYEEFAQGLPPEIGEAAVNWVLSQMEEMPPEERADMLEVASFFAAGLDSANGNKLLEAVTQEFRKLEEEANNLSAPEKEVIQKAVLDISQNVSQNVAQTFSPLQPIDAGLRIYLETASELEKEAALLSDSLSELNYRVVIEPVKGAATNETSVTFYEIFPKDEANARKLIEQLKQIAPGLSVNPEPKKVRGPTGARAGHLDVRLGRQAKTQN